MASSSASSTSDPETRFAFDMDIFLRNYFTKLIPTSGDRGIHDIISALYRAKPEAVVAFGGIHNSKDGKDTYISIRVYISNTFWYNVHVFGALRFKTFLVTRSEMFLKCDGASKTYHVDFRREDPEPSAKPAPAKKSIW
jgi:hypothetical protein